MNIQSFLVKQEGRENYVLLDTVTNHGHYFCGLGIGKIENNMVDLTPVGQQALEKLLQYAQSTNGLRHFPEITRLDRVTQQVTQTFSTAKQGDMIFFVCKDNHIYDAVFAALGYQSNNPFVDSAQ